MEDKEQFKRLFGKQLRVTRKQAGLSLEGLEDRTYINADHLGRIERGEKEPLLSTAAILRSALHIDVNAMLDDINKELDKRSDDQT